MSKYEIHLHPEQQQQLLDITHKGTTAVRTFKRAQVLLLSEQGYKDQDIVERVGVSIATVERTRKKFVKQGLAAALQERPRPGQPHKLDANAEILLQEIINRPPPDGQKRWTLQLLADCLVELNLVKTISDETIRRVLKSHNISLT